jgi:hypothetical protein
MRLPTNNIAVTLVAFAVMVALVPLLFCAAVLVRAVRGRKAPVEAAAAEPKGLWAVLDELSHARLL